MLRIFQLLRTLFPNLFRKKVRAKSNEVENIAPHQEQPVSENEPQILEIRKKRFCWCLDNGHGLHQLGKRSPFFELNGEQVQLLEWEFNRDIVVRITKQLDELGIEYIETAPKPETMGKELQRRTHAAKTHITDLPKVFVSVHANAYGDGGKWTTPKGIEVIHQANEDSKEIAKVFSAKISAHTNFKERRIIDNSEKGRGYYVLKKENVGCLAIMTENGFYTNKSEVKQLMKDEVRQKIADAHVEAIKYFEGFFDDEKITV